MTNQNGNSQRPPAVQKLGDLDNDEQRIRVGLCCSTCVFGRPHVDDKGNLTGHVLCHHGPPAVVAMTRPTSTREAIVGKDLVGNAETKPFAVWPIVNEDEWCGQFMTPPEWQALIVHRFGTQQQEASAND